MSAANFVTIGARAFRYEACLTDGDADIPASASAERAVDKYHARFTTYARDIGAVSHAARAFLKEEKISR